MAWDTGLPVALSKEWAVELAEPTRTTDSAESRPPKAEGLGVPLSEMGKVCRAENKEGPPHDVMELLQTE